MAIEKMKLLGITGPSKDLDKFLANVLFKSDVQIEDAKKVYNKGWKLEYYEYDYRIKEALKKAQNLLDKLNIQYKENSEMVVLENQIPTITERIDELNLEYEEHIKQIDENTKQIEQARIKIEDISKIEEININVKKLYDLQYIKFRYGSIPKKNLEEIKKEIDNLNTIMFEIKQIGDISWIMYFTTNQFVSSIDGIFNIQKFERELLPDDLLQTPKEYILNLKEQIRQKEYENSILEQKNEKIKKAAMTTLISYYRELQTYDKINNIKKYVVHDQNDTFYVVAWIPESNLKAMERTLKVLDDIDYVVKNADNPPTKLRNNKCIRPFETLVKMYRST